MHLFVVKSGCHWTNMESDVNGSCMLAIFLPWADCSHHSFLYLFACFLFCVTKAEVEAGSGKHLGVCVHMLALQKEEEFPSGLPHYQRHEQWWKCWTVYEKQTFPSVIISTFSSLLGDRYVVLVLDWRKDSIWCRFRGWVWTERWGVQLCIRTVM